MIGRYAGAASAPLALVLVLLCQPGTATADDVTVKKNGTPLMLAPTRNAPAQWKVNSGFPLTVVEERDGWVRVESGQLPDEGGELWVRAAQVAARTGDDRAPSGADEAPIGYRVELTGTPDMKFKLECRSVQDGHVSFRPHINRLPRSYEFSADAVNCFASKRQHHGELEVTLVEIYPSKERIIGRVDTSKHPVSIFARSRGPWGQEVVAIGEGGNLVLPPASR